MLLHPTVSKARSDNNSIRWSLEPGSGSFLAAADTDRSGKGEANDGVGRTANGTVKVAFS
jgi:hypothetical protein